MFELLSLPFDNFPFWTFLGVQKYCSFYLLQQLNANIDTSVFTEGITSQFICQPFSVKYHWCCSFIILCSYYDGIFLPIYYPGIIDNPRTYLAQHVLTYCWIQWSATLLLIPFSNFLVATTSDDSKACFIISFGIFLHPLFGCNWWWPFRPRGYNNPSLSGLTWNIANSVISFFFISVFVKSLDTLMLHIESIINWWLYIFWNLSFQCSSNSTQYFGRKMSVPNQEDDSRFVDWHSYKPDRLIFSGFMDVSLFEPRSSFDFFKACLVFWILPHGAFGE